MLDLQVKTRSGSSHLGKQKVYFTCHPDDFDRCFSEISKELLEQWDVAVLYTLPGAQVEEKELGQHLNGVQLLMIGVTPRLTQDPEGAAAKLLRLALERGIPVLPLVPTLSREEDKGLGTAFGAFSGNKLQLLDRNRPQVTPYEKKRENFLSTILIGKEQLEQIRSAFSSRFFLSYRQEDREQADTLLRRIHDHPLCWDTAVWYDDFLQPGSNYEDQIMERLNEAQMVLMGLTPRIWKPKEGGSENFVVSDEYPIAHKRKLIFPVEMEWLSPADWEKIREKLPGLPLAVPGDSPYFNLPLEWAVSQIPGFQQKQDTPERRYLIGLAFLNGVDVEVDRARALQLFQQAAEQGYLPAMERLSEMYRIGQGVEQDLIRSLRWRERLVCQRGENPEGTLWFYRKLLEETQWLFQGGRLSERYAYKLMSGAKALETLAGEAEPTYAAAFLELALEFRRFHYELDPIPPVGRFLITSLERLGNLYGLKEQYTQAYPLFQEAVSLGDKLLDQNARKDLWAQMNRIFMMGMYLWPLNDMAGAYDALWNCLTTCYSRLFEGDNNCSNPGKGEILELMAVCCASMSSMRGSAEAKLPLMEWAYRFQHKRCWLFTSQYLEQYFDPEYYKGFLRQGAQLELYSHMTRREVCDAYQCFRSYKKEYDYSGTFDYKEEYDHNIQYGSARKRLAILIDNYANGKVTYETCPHREECDARWKCSEYSSCIYWECCSHEDRDHIMKDYLAAVDAVQGERYSLYLQMYQEWHRDYFSVLADLRQRLEQRGQLNSEINMMLYMLFDFRKQLNDLYQEISDNPWHYEGSWFLDQPDVRLYAGKIVPV